MLGTLLEGILQPGRDLGTLILEREAREVEEALLIHMVSWPINSSERRSARWAGGWVERCVSGLTPIRNHHHWYTNLSHIQKGGNLSCAQSTEYVTVGGLSRRFRLQELFSFAAASIIGLGNPEALTLLESRSTAARLSWVLQAIDPYRQASQRCKSHL